MLVTMILIVALTAGATALVSMQQDSTHAAQITRTKISALACAEAGLATARTAVASSYAQWNSVLGTGEQPSWLASLARDLDGDNLADFELTLQDNEDELTGANDPAHDNDLAIYVVSTCVKYSDVPARVAELVRYSGGGSCYDAQLGGCGGNNNDN